MSAVKLASTTSATGPTPHRPAGRSSICAPSGTSGAAVEPGRCGSSLGRCGEPRSTSPRLLLTRVNPEWRVLGGHHRRVGNHTQYPAIQPEDEVEDRARVLAAEQQHHHGGEHEQADQPEPGRPAPRRVAEVQPTAPPPPKNTPATTYCGMPASHQPISGSPCADARDSRSAAAPDSRARHLA